MFNKIEYWYDKYTKSWVVRKIDFEGNQIGNAYYVYSKREALDIVNEFNKDIPNFIKGI